MKECPSCKKSLPDLAKFCTSCGTAVSISPQEKMAADEKVAQLKQRLESLSSGSSNGATNEAAEQKKPSWDSFVIRRPTPGSTDSESEPENEADVGGQDKVFSLEDRIKSKVEKDEAHTPSGSSETDETIRTLGSDTSGRKTSSKTDSHHLSQDEIEDMVRRKKEQMKQKMKSYQMDEFLDSMLAEASSAKKASNGAESSDTNAPSQASSDTEKATEQPLSGPEPQQSPSPSEQDANIYEVDNKQKAPSTPPQLKPGRGYLIEEEKPKYVFTLFSEHTARGMKGMCISRSNPKRIAQDFNIANSQMLWLTDSTTASTNIIPPSLERITYDIRTFIAANEDPIILLDGLEYLMSNNKFNPVIRFLRHLVDECSLSDSIMLIPISPMAISEQELKMIERELEVVETIR